MTPLSFTGHVPFPLTAVLAALADPAFHRWSRGDEAEVSAGHVGDVIRIRVASTGPAPQGARLLGLGATVRLVEDQQWDEIGPDTASGRFRVGVEGAPVRIAGSLRARAAGQGCDLAIDGSVTSDAPLVAGMVENAAAPLAREAMASQAAALTRWLSRG